MPSSVLFASPANSPQRGGAENALPLSDKARMTLLDQLEAWIDEEERLIAEIDRKVAATLGNVRGPWGRAIKALPADESNDRQTTPAAA